MAGRIILLRHGQTHSNVAHKLDTRPPGAELTERGRAQAREVGAELAEYCGAGHGSPGRLGTVVCGVSLRTQQTALLAMQAFEKVAGLPEHAMRLDLRTGIHEIFAGDHEMHSDEASHRAYTTALRGWLEGVAEARMPGGETYIQLLKRYRPVLEDLAANNLVGDGGEERDVLVVSHGAAIRTIAAHAAGVDPDFAFAGYLANCRYIVLEPGEAEFGQWKLVRWGDLGQQI